LKVVQAKIILQNNKVYMLKTCLALVEITEACNLRCPTCFADSDVGRYYSLEEVERMLDTVVENEGYADVVQFSGGEPTIHPQLLEILALATLGGIIIDALVPTAIVVRFSSLGVAAGVPLAALLGSVIYADILLLIPIGFALISHGASAPVVLTFMIAASGLSIPEMVILGRIFQPRLVVLFVGATLLVYMLLGFGFVWV
jgi:Radical SAM superfamily/Predicted permease